MSLGKPFTLKIWAPFASVFRDKTTEANKSLKTNANGAHL